MFTGIVQGVGTIDAIKDHGELRTFSIAFPERFTDDIEIGASVSVDGVCLTVTTIHSPVLIDFDVMLPSLRITTLADLATGALCISVERDGVWLHVYLDDSGTSGRVETATHPVRSDRPLCRSDAMSLPPVDGVFRFGSAAIGAYLDAHGWQRDWGFNGMFHPPATATTPPV